MDEIKIHQPTVLKSNLNIILKMLYNKNDGSYSELQMRELLRYVKYNLLGGDGINGHSEEFLVVMTDDIINDLKTNDGWTLQVIANDMIDDSEGPYNGYWTKTN